MKLKKLTKAEVKTYTGGIIWELWWKKDLLFSSTNETKVRGLADLINTGRDVENAYR